MNNTVIINTFNSDNNNVANIQTQPFQIMTIITGRILKSEPMIKKPLQHLQDLFVKIKKLIFMNLKQIVIKKICQLLVYNVISTIV